MHGHKPQCTTTSQTPGSESLNSMSCKSEGNDESLLADEHASKKESFEEDAKESGDTVNSAGTSSHPKLAVVYVSSQEISPARVSSSSCIDMIEKEITDDSV